MDGGTERRRDGETERRREKASLSPSVPRSLCPSVPPSLHLTVSPSLRLRGVFFLQVHKVTPSTFERFREMAAQLLDLRLPAFMAHQFAARRTRSRILQRAFDLAREFIGAAGDAAVFQADDFGRRRRDDRQAAGQVLDYFQRIGM